jgi:hypothetical protein
VYSLSNVITMMKIREDELREACIAHMEKCIHAFNQEIQFEVSTWDT